MSKIMMVVLMESDGRKRRGDAGEMKMRGKVMMENDGSKR